MRHDERNEYHGRSFTIGFGKGTAFSRAAIAAPSLRLQPLRETVSLKAKLLRNVA
jgi:hypothetical protein